MVDFGRLHDREDPERGALEFNSFSTGAQPRAEQLPRVLASGTRIGPYTLLSPLGRGGAGYVWTAVRQGALGFTQRTALKISRADRWDNDKARRRFEREARVGSALRHPNIRSIHDLGSVGPCQYMSMRWVDSSLSELLEHTPGHKLEPSVAAWLALQSCAALDRAHRFTGLDGAALPIVHRDVSPDNILLTYTGQVLLSDFAGSLTEADPDAPASSRSGAEGEAFFGKLAYAAPEALRGEPLDARADIFSIGCVLFEMLGGRPAFRASDDHSLMLAVLSGQSPKLGELAPRTPSALIEIVQTCLASERERRFENAEALRQALCACVRSSAFELEEITGEALRETLGERLKRRELELSTAISRLGAPRNPVTETLPLAARAPKTDDAPPVTATIATPKRAESAPVAPPMSSPAKRRRTAQRWTLGIVAAASLISIAAFIASHPPPADPLEAAKAPGDYTAQSPQTVVQSSTPRPVTRAAGQPVSSPATPPDDPASPPPPEAQPRATASASPPTRQTPTPRPAPARAPATAGAPVAPPAPAGDPPPSGPPPGDPPAANPTRLRGIDDLNPY
jgi:serine/threonine protein kinase